MGIIHDFYQIKLSEALAKQGGFMIHNLKIQMQFYEHIIEGKKRFEVRLNDRDYQVGDRIRLKEVNIENENDKMDSSVYRITYIHTGLGMKEGYVVLGIEPTTAK